MTQRITSRLELVAEANAAYWARRHTRSVLSGWRVPGERLEVTELAVSELVTNTIRHVTEAHPEQPPTRLTLLLHFEAAAPQLIVEVADVDARPPIRSGLPPIHAEGGRGLFLVEAVAKEVGYYQPLTGGKVVWCTIGLI